MRGDGTGAFSALSSNTTGLSGTNGVMTLACGDFSGDGRADVVAGTGWNAPSGPAIRFSTTNSDGTMGTSWANGPATTYSWMCTTGVIAGDFWGSGSLGFLAMCDQDPTDAGNSTGNRHLTLHYGSNLSSTTTITPPVSPTGGVAMGKCLGVADLELDGKQDFAVSVNSASVNVYQATTFAIVSNLDASAGAPAVSSPKTGRICFGDLDGDGRDDLIVTTSYWAVDAQPISYSGSYALNLAGNGGTLGLVFWLNSST
jgi:hypothetical protein